MLGSPLPVTRTIGPPSSHKSSWMFTFGDLIALLLAFFVLLVSMSQIKVEAWQAVVEALSKRLNQTQDVTVLGPSADRNVSRIMRPKAIELGYLEAVLAEKLRADRDFGRVSVNRHHDRLVLSFPTDHLFRPNTTDLDESAIASIQALGGFFRSIANGITVTGHAEIQDGGDDRAWELSIARAVVVADALRMAGLDRAIAANGLGDSRYYDGRGDLSAEQRDRLARRIDIVIRDGPYWRES